MTSVHAPTSLYRYYDEHGCVLYVGITSRGHRRFAEHLATKEWWPFVGSQEVEHFTDRPAALQRERSEITRLRPPFNTQHNPGHELMREAYLSMRSTIPTDGDMTLNEWCQKLGKSIPLAITANEGPRLELLVGPGFWPVAKCFRLPTPHLILNVGGSKWGHVVDLEHRGPTVALICKTRRPLPPVREARLRYANRPELEKRGIIDVVSVTVERIAGFKAGTF